MECLICCCVLSLSSAALIIPEWGFTAASTVCLVAWSVTTFKPGLKSFMFILTIFRIKLS